MTEFEYLYMANEYTNTVFNHFSILFSLISAFLVVSYLSAEKFGRTITVTLLLLYSMGYFYVAGAIINGHTHMAEFIELMSTSDYDFSWTPYASLDFEFVVANSLVLLGYLCSVLFFFYVKKQRSVS